MDDEKGFQNLAGQNNCFLNVGLQTLWHITSFNRGFNAESHVHREPCVVCALQLIFSNYEYSEEAVLPPQVLRETLDRLYQAEGKFKLGDIDDAAECLGAILSNVHDAVTGAAPGEEKSCEPRCVAHRVFGIGVLEQTNCIKSSCQATSEPLTSEQFIYYTYVTALKEEYRVNPLLTFDQALHNTNKRDLRECPNKDCRAPSPLMRFLMSDPEVFTIGLVWPTDDPSVQDIVQLFNQLDLAINVKYIFDAGNDHVYKLRGMICYWGHHYDAYFYNKSKNKWIVFDDATVKEVGSGLEHVRDKCVLGHFHPCVLFYVDEAKELEFGDASTDPKQPTENVSPRSLPMSQRKLTIPELVDCAAIPVRTLSSILKQEPHFLVVEELDAPVRELMDTADQIVAACPAHAQQKLRDELREILDHLQTSVRTYQQEVKAVRLKRIEVDPEKLVAYKELVHDLVRCWKTISETTKYEAEGGTTTHTTPTTPTTISWPPTTQQGATTTTTTPTNTTLRQPVVSYLARPIGGTTTTTTTTTAPRVLRATPPPPMRWVWENNRWVASGGTQQGGAPPPGAILVVPAVGPILVPSPAAAPTTATLLVCPSCKRPSKGTANFCGGCGWSLKRMM